MKHSAIHAFRSQSPLRTTRQATIQPALCPHPHRPSQSTKQTINPLSWRGPCSCHRQGEKQQRRRSKRQFILILIPTVPRIQQNRQSTRYLGRDRAVVVDKERSSEDEDPNSTSSSSPTSLALNNTDNRPPGTEQFSTRRQQKQRSNHRRRDKLITISTRILLLI
jgi:hypothetical protein